MCSNEDPTQPKINKLINFKKDVYTHTHTHTHNYYSAIKKNEILPFVTIWIDPGGIMPSEICQTEKDKYCVLSLIC